MFLKEGSQRHACQDAEDDVGEVQHGQVGAGEEDDVDEHHEKADAGDAGKEEEGPGKVQQICGKEG